MFGIEPSEYLLVAIVALVVIGPKDLPRVMRVIGRWVGKARGMARHFRSGFDEMVRQAELEEMEKRWAEENARIMAEHPYTPPPEEEADDAHFAQPQLPGIGNPAKAEAVDPAQNAATVAGDAPSALPHQPSAAGELSAAPGSAKPKPESAE